MEIKTLPDVGRIEGLSLIGPPASPAQCQVELQYTGRTPPGQWHSLKMPLLDALYLCNLLEAMAVDAKVEHLRRPPGTAQ